MPIPDTPYTRKEAYLNAVATGDSSGIPETPYTREEMYLDAIARNGGGGGGGGSSTLSGLTDVDISNPADGQTLVYNAASQKWKNGTSGGGGALNIVVSLVDDTPTFDKTYNEIKNAFLSGKKCIIRTVRTESDESEPENDYIITDYAEIVSLNEVEAGTPGQTTMLYTVKDSNGEFYGTDSENGYPGGAR